MIYLKVIIYYFYIVQEFQPFRFLKPKVHTENACFFYYWEVPYDPFEIFSDQKVIYLLLIFCYIYNDIHDIICHI